MSEKPGLPSRAARAASQMGERLDRCWELLEARQARRDAADLSPADELARLRQVEDRYLDVLADAAFAEACRYDSDLVRPLVRLAEDYFLMWSGVVDAPVGYRLTLDEVRDRGWPEDRITKAAQPDEDGVLFNRAGPGEKCLTVAALMEAWESPEARAAFRLTPDKVQTCTTADHWQNKAGEWEQSEVYWDPWPPDEVPARLPKGWVDRY